ncbi:uncharacterized protein LOC132699278 [Cylas formicarius]|uniref:uncharacterized protein LOC132699278 n=1 Tax=Cylas formicarius TaxID=197179 RepID=UPI002958B747|nr:uncharacterized protein LOC132699278 [Cylas formicarius]
MSPIKFIFTLLAFTLSLDLGDGIKCFQCNSVEDPGCGDIQANETASPFLQECVSDSKMGGHLPFCRKLKQAVKTDRIPRIVRSCGWILDKHRERTDYCKKGDTDFILRTNCACFSDACNGSTRISSSPFVWLFSVITVYIASFKCT